MSLYQPHQHLSFRPDIKTGKLYLVSTVDIPVDYGETVILINKGKITLMLKETAGEPNLLIEYQVENSEGPTPGQLIFNRVEVLIGDLGSFNSDKELRHDQIRNFLTGYLADYINNEIRVTSLVHKNPVYESTNVISGNGEIDG